MRPLHEFFQKHTAEYVILHARSRAKRGRNPSATFDGITNPREALQMALTARKPSTRWALTELGKSITHQVMQQIIKVLELVPASRNVIADVMKAADDIDHGRPVELPFLDRYSRRRTVRSFGPSPSSSRLVFRPRGRSAISTVSY